MDNLNKNGTVSEKPGDEGMASKCQMLEKKIKDLNKALHFIIRRSLMTF